MMNRFIAQLISVAIAAAMGSAAAKTLLIKNAVVHTVTKGNIENGQVLVTDGKITTVAKGDESLQADEVVDLKGAHLYPGFINPVGSLGLVEINQIRATRDMAESGEFTPDVKSWLAVNPDSDLLAAALANGVTHTVAVPSGTRVSGQSGLIQTGGGWTVEDLAAKGPLAMHLYWPSMTLDTTPREQARDKERFKSLEEQAKERRMRLKELEDFFAQAESYAAQQHTETKKIPAWEAMIPIVRGEIPLVIHADSYLQIKSALKFAEQRKYRVIITGGRDAWRLAKEIAAQKIPVIFERVYNDGDGLSSGSIRDTEPYDVHFRAPSILAEAGVKVAITGGLGGDEASNVRNIPYVAAQAMAFGLSHDEALKSVTLNPAEIFGVEDRLGSIDPGKEATFFCATGDALDIRSRVEKVWIKGKSVELTNRQTRLYDKYRGRPKP
ncbi:MAG TPA: amidohydrolase family protein [Verrucomicrobiae bacterium]|nr:amidohydrolase family protein [Verrucomicrobiae bacterium]